MSWFQKLCRNTGLIIHKATTPGSPAQDDDTPKTTVIKHEVVEEKLQDNITLRRTTIEEIEIKPDSPPSQNPETKTPDPPPPPPNE